MSTLSCPLCSLSLSPSSLESHLRLELDNPHLRCRLCRLHFTSDAAAQDHFRGPFAKHPAQPTQLLQLDRDPAKEARLVELVRLAEGGQRAVEERLCVCGQCRLLCREDFRLASGDARERAANSFEAPRPREPNYEAPEMEPQSWRPSPMQDESRVSPDETLRQEHGEQSQPVPEASEAVDQMLVDVKPDLADLKPQINKDGKVACIQCGMRIEKGFFKQHAIGAHSTARPFSCSLCPHNEKTRGALAKHQRKDHGTELSDETFIFAGSEDKIKEIIEQCFGAAKDTDWARIRCQPCDKLVNKKDASNHVGHHHVKKPLHACKLCGFTIMFFSAGDMNKHVKKQHNLQPGPDTVDSSQAQHYAPIIKNMIPQLFAKE